MPKTVTEVKQVWFRAVAALHEDTAARDLPLVVRVDDIARQRVGDIPHCHRDFFALYLVQKGRGTHIIDGVPYGVSRGDVYVMGMGMTHLYSDCDSLVLDALYFSPRVFDPATLEVLGSTPGFQSLFVEDPLRRQESAGGGGRWLHLTPDVHARVEEEIAELRAEWAAGTPAGTLLTRGLFVRLLVHLARRYARSQPPSAPGTAPREATVAAAVRYLDAHFCEPVRIEEVAASVFLSPDHFTKVFAAAMGRTPRDYLRHLRLERAGTLLATTTLSVSEVGLRAGFGEASYFTRAFKAATGMTPRAYRERAR